LDFAPVEGNPSDLLMSGRHSGALSLTNGWYQGLVASLRYWREARAVFARMLENGWAACRNADALAVSLPTNWGYHIALALDVPCFFAPVQPLTRTRTYPSALLPITRSLGAAGNRLTHRLVEQALWWPWRAELNRWRTRILGLTPLWADPFDEIYRRGVPFLYGYSPHVAPRPEDWPAAHVVTGYWWLPSDPTYTPPPALEQFLADSPLPIYIGFGNLPSEQPRATLALIAEAATRAGLRAVVLADTTIARSLALPASVFTVPFIPHEWLFPRVAAAVHRGGAGTTAASLRAGLPTLVVPSASDGFFWGARIAALGAGPQPLPRYKLTAPRLAEALVQLVSDPAGRARAQAVAEKLSREDGAGLATELIRRGLR
ncbi:MAG: glycosyltransferase, partial [Anaerolineales bacterium]|nr:glycosyltransferase [Anaerolineales bacterium]